jgi:hypothetical protein
MLIHGFPLSVSFPQDFSDADRFWYWRGASGQKYIHSVYPRGTCPPVPGAVFIAVRKIGNLRTAIAVDRFASVWDDCFDAFGEYDADEIHVHLLARNSDAANRVLQDLQAAFSEQVSRHESGFHEAPCPPPAGMRSPWLNLQPSAASL